MKIITRMFKELCCRHSWLMRSCSYGGDYDECMRCGKKKNFEPLSYV